MHLVSIRWAIGLGRIRWKVEVRNRNIVIVVRRYKNVVNVLVSRGGERVEEVASCSIVHTHHTTIVQVVLTDSHVKNVALDISTTRRPHRFQRGYHPGHISNHAWILTATTKKTTRLHQIYYGQTTKIHRQTPRMNLNRLIVTKLTRTHNTEHFRLNPLRNFVFIHIQVVLITHATPLHLSHNAIAKYLLRLYHHHHHLVCLKLSTRKTGFSGRRGRTIRRSRS
jgi:hypothetical protein